ncbi:MAG: hypothetical protein J7M14_01910, partial [Planctomycetes bacterium]|nr:hypothetical protein [Planctomycetota bacterium]
NTAGYSDPPTVFAVADTPMRVTNISLLNHLSGMTSTELGYIHDGFNSTRNNGRAGTTGSNILEYGERYVIRPLNPKAPNDNVRFLPFGPSDMLELAWRGGVARGRLHEALDKRFGDDTLFRSARKLLTTWSSGRILTPAPVTGDTVQTYKADLNKADYDELFNAFFNALPRGVRDMTYGNDDDERDRRRRLLAAQLAVNVMDFRDEDNNITVRDVDSQGSPLRNAANTADVTVCGFERQAYITEAAYTIKRISPVVVRRYYAIELYNPYETPIDTSGWKVRVGPDEENITTAPIPPRKRLVLFNFEGNGAVENDLAFDPDPLNKKQKITILNLKQSVLITRPAPGTTSGYVVMGAVSPWDFQDRPPSDGRLANPGDQLSECIRRDDSTDKALYALALYQKGINKDITNTAESNLGRENNDPPGSVVLPGNPKPVPPYIRNSITAAYIPVDPDDDDPDDEAHLSGVFLNIADLNRIYYVGPSESRPVDRLLAGQGPGCDPDDPANGRLNPIDAPGKESGYTWPADTPDPRDMPLGAIVSDYFVVNSPMSDLANNDGNVRPRTGAKAGELLEIPVIDDEEECVVYGQINVNNAPEDVLRCLGLTQTQAQDIQTYRYNDNGKDLGAPGFASVGEAAIALELTTANNTYDPANAYSAANQANYHVDDHGNDDGLATDSNHQVKDDLIKTLVPYTWLSNLITVRSDVFIVYIYIQVEKDPDPLKPQAPTEYNVQRYVGVIDRSNCRHPNDRPMVRMFVRIED